MPNNSDVQNMDLDSFIKSWCGEDRCVEILNRSFPPNVKLPKNIEMFSTLLRDIYTSEINADSEIPHLTAVYGAVGVSSAVANLYLLYQMLKIQFKSSSAVFLTTLMFLDFYSALTLLIELYFLYNKNMPVMPPEPWKRHALQCVHVFSQLFYMFILLLVAVDRWIAYNTMHGRLFLYHRKCKFCCSLLVFVFAAIAVNSLIPQTVDIMLHNDKVEVYVCTVYWCTGSPILTHRFRSTKDTRMLVFLRFFQTGIAVVCFIIIPLYGCTWNAVTKKADIEKLYMKERNLLTTRGQEIIYFGDQHRPKLKTPHNLPVIYEVEEDNENDVIFPYSLHILHRETSLCSLTMEDSFFYYDKPVPENAQPVEGYNVLLRNFDNSVDQPGLLPNKALRKLQIKSQFKPIPISRLHSRNFNQNSKLNQLQRISQQGCQVYVESPPIFSQGCQCTRNIHKNMNLLSPRQTAFSISYCCCNQAAPVECHANITYINNMESCNTPSSSTSYNIENCLRISQGNRDVFQTMVCNKTSIPAFRELAVASLIRDAETMCDAGSSSWLYQSNNTKLYIPFNQENNNCDIQSCRNDLESLHDVPAIGHSRDSLATSESKYTIGTEMHDMSMYEDGTSVDTDYFSQRNSVTSDSQRYSLSDNKVKKKIHNANKNNKTSADTPKHKNTPVADALSAQTLMILYLVREHFIKHSIPLKPLGIPESLDNSSGELKVAKSINIISRLLFITLFYFIMCGIPCLIELTVIPYNTYLYNIPYSLGLIQFISLLFFSRDFRHRLRKSVSCILCTCTNRKETTIVQLKAPRPSLYS